jgi:DNA-binding NtrC family response regulator
MVVDDEVDIVSVFKRSLELRGYEVFAFTNPLLALEHLKTNVDRYGLLISDVRMPIMNGLDFAKEAQKISLHLPIVIMSAFSMTDLHIPAELKIAELLEKPITINKLAQLVLKYNQRASSEPKQALA